MKHLVRIASFLLAMLVLPDSSKAQCPMNNTAFKAGEKLSYDLYFNWNFIWVKCGSAYYTVNADKYDGQDVLRNDLLFTTSKKCDMFFVMRDTLISYITPDMVPLYFRKGAGGDDISGDYNTYDVTEEQTIDGHTVLCKGKDGLIYTATWTDGTYSYAVMCDAGMNVEQLSVWAETLA